MEKFKLLGKIKELYANGDNIIQFLRNLGKKEKNDIEDILISYDFQSGSYVKAFYKNTEFIRGYCNALASVINKLGNYNSIIEIGVGEATTLGVLLNFLSVSPKTIFGFDISWSRLKFAKEFLNEQNFKNIQLFTADLFEIPLPDNSIDVVYTSHSIEPNGGREEDALKELFRIANKYVVLLEPCYELANEDARKRMTHHGYVKNLSTVAKNLGYNVIEHRLFDFSSNPLNPTGLLVIKKNENTNNNDINLFCPITKTKLDKYDNVLFTKEGLLAYPIIDEIPCLLKENAILATHFLTNYKEFRLKV